MASLLLDRPMNGELIVAAGRRQWNRASTATDASNPVICRDTWARNETARRDVSGRFAGPVLALLLSPIGDYIDAAGPHASKSRPGRADPPMALRPQTVPPKAPFNKTLRGLGNAPQPDLLHRLGRRDPPTIIFGDESPGWRAAGSPSIVKKEKLVTSAIGRPSPDLGPDDAPELGRKSSENRSLTTGTRVGRETRARVS